MSGGSLWQVDIQKRYQNEYWTNVWHVQAATQADARQVALGIIELEKVCHCAVVEFISFRLAPYPGPSEGTIYPINQNGTQNGSSFLPLFNVMRVDFTVPTGRPSRKYWRLPVSEGVTENGVFTNPYLSSLQAEIDEFFAAPGGNVVDVDGQVIEGGRIAPSIGMRQLRRGSRKRTTPVIPLGTP